MKKLVSMLVVIAAFVFATAMMAAAQTKTFETYVGAQVVRENIDAHRAIRFDRSTDSVGFNVATTGFVTEDIGLTGELGTSFGGGLQDNSQVTLMGGLTIKNRSGKANPFIRVLAGVARERIASDQLHNVFETSDLGFSFAAGGGLDVKVSKRVSLRVFQADYMQTRFHGALNHNLRLGAGIVF